MQLKRLDLHGFKTFAGKTQFHFSDGITAVVGPNGSGKSNLADSVRWILGEQRAAVLRAKKSEDMIFGGTEKRPRMGMAQGFLTIDNSEGLLPIDFSEVVIGRRIYRSGESEYLINNNKVRLKDVQELLAHAGIGAGTYTVVGQGLVDAALALRAEERRPLIEDAAGLGAYQGRRDEALRRLSQTSEHLTRVRDILAELEPRVGRLKRQAERAEEYNELRDELRELLRQFYGYRWGQAAQSVAESKALLAEGRTELQRATLEVTAIDKRLDALRQRQQEMRETLEQGRRERGRLRSEAERLRRERAVAQEREQGFARQQATLAEERQALAREVAEAQARVETHQLEAETLRAARAEAQGARQQAQARLAEAEAVRETVRRSLEEARRALAKLTARQGELAQQQAALETRQRELAQECETHEQALATLEERLARRESDIALLVEALERVKEQHAALAEERKALTAARQEARAAQQRTQQGLHEVQRRVTELTTRRDVLARLREEGAGYEAGVRALLAEQRRFGGTLLGPVADQLRVPEAVAGAISAALAGLLQAVVLADDGAAIRQWLSERQVGRVTLLPLPALRGPETVGVPRGAGVLGRAADLVQAEDPALLEHLLGEWLVLKDWSAVEALGRAAEGWNLVTLDGQLRTRGGAIVAGQGGGAGSTLLAQSREWAELPERIRAVEEEQSVAQRALDHATEQLHDLEAHLQKLERELLEHERDAQKREQALQREQRDAEKLQQERGWRQELIQKNEREHAALGERAARLGVEIEQGTAERQQAEAHIGELEQQVEATHPGTLREAVERARTHVAILDEQLAGWQRNHKALAEAAARLEQRQAEKTRQGTQLQQEAETLARRMASLEQEATKAETALEASLQQTRPLEQEQGQNEQRLAELETQQLALRKRRQEREEQVHTAQLAHQAAEERLAHLREQIEGDLGMVEIEEGELIHQSLLPIEELVTSLPKVVVLPEGLENDVRRLRRRIGYLGTINPDAPAEYAELNERYTFLKEQSEDLTRASQDLRRVVAELDAIMEERFVRTFHAIDEAFREYFTRLFNGGQARLELSEPEEIQRTGIEIIARPPGKRAQSISLLSGGERALTAAALIFAILKVSPAPFCVLDEVDAMLDEANVGRFRDMLAELSHKTQFIVVTHNRGTIEAAQAIYGISQTDPGVSEVISLQLEEAVARAKQ